MQIKVNANLNTYAIFKLCIDAIQRSANKFIVIQTSNFIVKPL